jgi:hypothetical protein
LNICSICRRGYDGHGNNASPVADALACDDCNATVVIPARLRGETVWKYGRFEGHPCVYGDERAFVLFVTAEGWREMPFGEVFNKVGVMSRSDFDAYPDLPPIPR